MEAVFADFHFLRPLWLLALIPAGFFVLLITFLQGQSTQWARNIDPVLLPFLLDRHQSGRQVLPVFGLLLIWILSAIALSGPVWKELPMPVQENDDALIVVMDLSLSLYADDLRPNRITRSRRKLVDVLNRRSDEGQTALVVYAGDAHAVTPITDDVETITNLVSALDPNIMPVPGSKPESGIQLALELLDNAGLEAARVLLMTDGIRREEVTSLAELINTSGHSLSVLGIGTDEGAPIPMSEGGFLRDNNNAIVIPRLDRALLQDLANRTEGRYSDIQLDDDDINYLLSQSLFEETENLQQSEREYDSWQETGHWLVLLLLPLAAFAFRKGWVLCFPLVLVLLPVQQPQAAEWESLWKNEDQRGREAFSDENFGEAAQTFDDPAWRAASNYRSGNYEAALDDLEGLTDASAHYNRGNALTQLFRLEEAIAAYDAALELDPDNADASHNKMIAEQLLEQQEQQQQEEQDQQQQQQQNQEQQNQQGENEQDQQEGSEESSEQENPQDQEGDQNQEQQESESEAQQSESEEQQESQQQQTQRRQPTSEEEQSMQQWLGRIRDDPAELLRNKFRQQSQLQIMEQIQNPELARERAQEQIW